MSTRTIHNAHAESRYLPESVVGNRFPGALVTSSLLPTFSANEPQPSLHGYDRTSPFTHQTRLYLSINWVFGTSDWKKAPSLGRYFESPTRRLGEHLVGKRDPSSADSIPAPPPVGSGKGFSSFRKPRERRFKTENQNSCKLIALV
jgi:hypothetical protein